jgi:hypothetical protein
VIITYSTLGGNTVTWTGGEPYDANKWNCNGCQEHGLTGSKAEANRHAAECRAISNHP